MVSAMSTYGGYMENGRLNRLLHLLHGAGFREVTSCRTTERFGYRAVMRSNLLSWVMLRVCHTVQYGPHMTHQISLVKTTTIIIIGVVSKGKKIIWVQCIQSLVE
jgi:hypothetical protein